MIVTQISIDLSGKYRYEYVVAKQGDADSRLIQVTLLSDSRIYVIDDQTAARVSITKPDKTEVLKDCTINNNMVEVLLDANMLAAAGTAEAEILLTDLNGTVTSASFDIKVVATKTGKNAESSDDYDSWKVALAYLQAEKKALETAKANGEFDGVGIESVEQTTTSKKDDGINIVTVKRTDGTITLLEIKNGSTGRSAYQSYVENGGTLTEIQWLASMAQGSPEYKESVEQMTDKNKVYLMNINDVGHLYAWGTTEMATGQNLIPYATEPTDPAAIFNSLGYKNDAYASSATPFYGAATDGTVVSGFVPFTLETVLYVKGVTINVSNSHNRINFFSKERTSLNMIASGTAINNAFTIENLDEQYYKLTPITSYFGTKVPAYCMMSFIGRGENWIVSNTPIGTEKVEGFIDTGLTYTPNGDNEARIAGLENWKEQAELRLSEVENASDVNSNVADYVVQEANRVISEVIKCQTGNTLTMLVITDMHNLENDANIKTGNKHAGQGAKIITDSIAMDGAAMLGDHGWSASLVTTPNQSTEDIIMANRYIADPFKDVDNYRTPGNHDLLTIIEEGVDGNLTQGQMYAFIGRYNKQGKTYFYRDYVDKKVRVIMLNTVDENNVGGCGMTPEQLMWFAQSLDLSEKEDAEDWKIIILSHHPLDWNQYTWGTNIMNAANILAAYVSGVSITFTENGITNTYDFTGKNKAKVMVQIHGHLHSYKVDYIYSTIGGEVAPTTVKRMAMPNACFTRNNTYAYEDTENLNGIEYGEFAEDGVTPLTYSKTAGTAEDTAFCVLTFDLDNDIVYAHHYGAGIDRVVEC